MNFNQMRLFFKNIFKRERTSPSFTLVLGGGGARGLAHIGVLKALEKAKLTPTLIVGTSMGALIGGMYSQYRDAKTVEDRMRSFLQGDFFKRIGLEQFSETNGNNTSSVWDRFTSYLRQRFFFSKSVLGTGMFAQSALLHSLHKLLEDQDIQDLPIHFAAVASDLKTGEEIVFTSGSIVMAIAASSAVPGVVAPLVIGHRFLADGTVTSTIPVPAARSLSSNSIIAVDVRHSIDGFDNFRHGYEVVMHASEITSYKLNDAHLQNANIVLKPDVTNIEWNQFDKIDQCIQAGEQAVENNLKKISSKLQKTNIN